ncbi:NAD(P)-binding protein [Coprinellus micaceus]|uniref:NAD(P)-binding protein n=1 Tax=Coprinellus micaceus TaxID=71717 RepID=A0A4Y7TKJ1_COPMI|nr:NAD(P)-binding protein [Coprinellus micaceus]
MKIAVTGCNGRVGRPTVKAALARGYEVVGIDNTTPPRDAFPKGDLFTFHQGDLLKFDVALALLKGCDAVIHLAGIPNPADFKVESHNTNVVLSWNVLRACAELGINRVAQASSVNIITLVFAAASAIEYFPLDEDHPCTPDEPYGLSKLIAETQAATLVRRFPQMRIASLRLSWAVPRSVSAARDPEEEWTARDLWGYVHHYSAADAFIRATAPHRPWTSGHEAFFIVAPEIAHQGDSRALKEKWYPNTPIKEGKTIDGLTGFFDCTKAQEYLGWVHRDEWPELE